MIEHMGREELQEHLENLANAGCHLHFRRINPFHNMWESKEEGDINVASEYNRIVIAPQSPDDWDLVLTCAAYRINPNYEGPRVQNFNAVPNSAHIDLASTDNLCGYWFYLDNSCINDEDRKLLEQQGHTFNTSDIFNKREIHEPQNLI